MFTQVAIYTWQLRQRYAKTVKRHGNPCLRFGLYSVSCGYEKGHQMMNESERQILMIGVLVIVGRIGSLTAPF